MVAAKVTLTAWVATEVKTEVSEEAVVGESELWADTVEIMVKLVIVLLFFLPECPASDRNWQREHLCMKLWQLV